MIFGLIQRNRNGQDNGAVAETSLADKIIDHDPAAWTKVKKDRILSLMVGNEKNIYDFGRALLSAMAEVLKISQGALFLRENRNGKDVLSFKIGYAFMDPKEGSVEFESGEGLVGQVAKEGNALHFNSVPPGYITIQSGLGKSSPSALYIFPVKSENEVVAVIELASFQEFHDNDVDLLNSLQEYLASKIKRFSSLK